MPWAIALICGSKESELISLFSSGVNILKSEETKVFPVWKTAHQVKCHAFIFQCTWTDTNWRTKYTEAKHQVSKELPSEEKYFYGEMSSE